MHHPQITIELLNTAHEMFRAAPAAAGRQIYHIGSLLAREHLELGEVPTAQRLLQSIAGPTETRTSSESCHEPVLCQDNSCCSPGSGGLHCHYRTS